MEKNILVNMGILKAFFNNKKDILEIFVPFVEYTMVKLNSEYIDIDELRDKINEYCNLKLPITTIKTILRKLSRRGKIRAFEKYSKIQLIYSYGDENLEYTQCFEKVSRDKNKLIRDYKIFAQKEDFSDEDIMNLFYNFIDCNIECLDIIDENYKACSTEDKDLVSISDFCVNIKNYDDYNYNTFKEIYYGFLLYNLTQNNIYKNLVSDKKIKTLSVFIDSSYLFRILNLQNDLLNYASNELFDLLKENKYSISVFSQTVDEVRKVLVSFYEKIANNDYPEKVSDLEALSMEGVLGAIYRRKMDLYTFSEYIKNIDESIRLLGINIINSSTHIDGINYNEDAYYQLLYNKVSKYLSGKITGKIDISDLKNDNINIDNRILSNSTLNSFKNKTKLDMRILKYIEERRHERKYNFADSEIIFLTCDNVLYTFSSNCHSSYRSIPEAVTEEVFTNVLWINRPDKMGDIPLTLTLSIFQSSKYVEFNVLKKFNACVKEFSKKRPEESKYIGDIYANQDLIYKLSKAGECGDNNEEFFGIIQECVQQNRDYVESMEIRHKQEMDDTASKLNQLKEDKEQNQRKIGLINYEFEKLKSESSKKINDQKQKRLNELQIAKKNCDKIAKLKALLVRLLAGGIVIAYVAFVVFYCIENGFDKTKSLITVILIFPPALIFLFLLITKKDLKKLIVHELDDILMLREYKKFGLNVDELEELLKDTEIFESDNGSEYIGA